MTFPKVHDDAEWQVYIAWHGSLCFTIHRFNNPEDAYTLSIWNHAANELLIEKEIPKLSGRGTDRQYHTINPSPSKD